MGSKPLDSVGLAMNLVGQDDVTNIAIRYRLRSMVSFLSTSFLLRERKKHLHNVVFCEVSAVCEWGD